MPFPAVSRSPASLRRKSFDSTCTKPEANSEFVLMSKTGIITTGFSNQATLQVHMSLVVTAPVVPEVQDTALDHVWAETLEGEVWTPGEVATVPAAQQDFQKYGHCFRSRKRTVPRRT